MPLVTIDAIESITADSEANANEIGSIRTLSVGLRNIAEMVTQREESFRDRTAGQRIVAFGVDPDGSKGSLDMIACYFHWFGVSVCNLARLVGFIRGLAAGDFTPHDLGDPSRFKAVREAVEVYLSRVPELSPVLAWRNKIGAHFALTDPRKGDDPATLDMSVVFPVAFRDTRYYVGEWTLIRAGRDGVHSSALANWSITQMFESLIPRYWPQIRWERIGETGPGVRENL